jgi:luciferase family oxidoreductase group 1
MPADHPFARLSTLLAETREPLPDPEHHPELWLLGSSPQSGIWAAGLGLPYCFADFINPRGADIAAHYRQAFVADQGSTPRVMVAAWVVCAETDEQAWRLASSHRMLMELMLRGQLIAVPSVEEALRWLAADGLPLEAPPRGRRTIVGTPQRVKEQIEALAAEYGAEEVMLVNILHDHAARKRSYELVAEAFA